MTTTQSTGDPRNEKQADRSTNSESQSGQEQNTNFDNPQGGDKWDNYQTRELNTGEKGAGESAEEAATVFENDNNA